MKKTKIMLLSLLVLVIGGGALAIKANKKFNKEFCATTAGQLGGVFYCTTNPVSCPLLENVETAGHLGFISCITPIPPGGCTAITSCTTLAFLIDD